MTPLEPSAKDGRRLGGGHQQVDAQISPEKTDLPMNVESRSIDYIPLAERHGKVSDLFPVWFTGNAQLATIASGVIGVSAGGNLFWAACAIVLGSAVATFFVASHSSQGPILGLAQMIQSRPQFGYVGALLVWLVALVNYVGYNVFNQILAGDAMHELLGANQRVTYAVFTVMAVLVAVAGYDWIHGVQRYLSYALIAVLAVFSIGAATTLHLDSTALDPANFNGTAFLLQFGAAAATQLSWAIYVSDYSRYLPPTVGVRASFWWTYSGLMVGGIWMMLVGATVAASFGADELVHSVLQTGNAIFPHFGAVVLIAALPGLVTIAALNFYGGSLTLLSAVDSFRTFTPTFAKRLIAIIPLAVLAFSLTIVASGDFLNQFSSFLAVLLYLFTPWTAVNLVDFFIVRKAHYSVREIFNPRGLYGRWNWRGISAYVIGFATMVPFFSTSYYEGPIAASLGGADIAMFIGLPVSGFYYYLVCRSLDVEAERQLAKERDTGLDVPAALPN